MKIPFNKPAILGNELDYIKQAVDSGQISGNGEFTKKCQNFFSEKYGFQKCLLTTSCTDALEMAAILCDIKPGDEVILPSYTFVSTANAFVLRGAKIILADSKHEHPNIDINDVIKKITNKTKVIVVVHYAGVACDMDEFLDLAHKHNLFLIEDAAQAVDSSYKNKSLGGMGHLATFSFHETKNIICGEGGMLVVNDEKLMARAEIIWEKGTNRSAFFRGQIDKYSWVDIGSSYLPGEILAAFLYAQLENLNKIQEKRKYIWDKYYERLKSLSDQGYIKLPIFPNEATNNAHLFHILTRCLEERSNLINFLKEQSILAVFHYIPLHTSPFFKNTFGEISLPNAEYFGNHLLRLPLYYELEDTQMDHIVDSMYTFYNQNSGN